MNVSLWGAFNKVADTLFPANYDKHPLIRYLKERKLNKTMSEEELKVVDDDARKKTTEIESLEDYFSEDNVRKRQLEDDLANLGDDIADIEDEMRKAEDKQDLQELERLRTELAEAKEERERIKQEIAEIERRQKADKDQVLEEATIASLINSMDLEKNANVVDSLYFDYPDKDLGDHITVFDDRDTTGWVDYVVGDEMLSVYNQNDIRVMLHTNIKNRTPEEIAALKAEALADSGPGKIVIKNYNFAKKDENYKFIIDTNTNPPTIIADPPASKLGKSQDQLKDIINGNLKDPNNQVAKAFAANRFNVKIGDLSAQQQNQWADELLSGAGFIKDGPGPVQQETIEEEPININTEEHNDLFDEFDKPETTNIDEPPLSEPETPIIEDPPVITEPPIIENTIVEEPPVVEKVPAVENVIASDEVAKQSSDFKPRPNPQSHHLYNSDRDAIHKIRQANDDLSCEQAEIVYRGIKDSGITTNYDNINTKLPMDKIKTLAKDDALTDKEKIKSISATSKNPELELESAVNLAKASIKRDEINQKISQVNTGDGVRNSLEITRLLGEQNALKNEINPLKSQLDDPTAGAIWNIPGITRPK